MLHLSIIQYMCVYVCVLFVHYTARDRVFFVSAREAYGTDHLINGTDTRVTDILPAPTQHAGKRGWHLYIYTVGKVMTIRVHYCALYCNEADAHSHTRLVSETNNSEQHELVSSFALVQALFDCPFASNMHQGGTPKSKFVKHILLIWYRLINFLLTYTTTRASQ